VSINIAHQPTKKKKKKTCNKVSEQMRKWYGRRKIFSSHCPIGEIICYDTTSM
jgi:hypothetical protein